MQLDRDLNVALVRAIFSGSPRSRRGWEMLAATGVRGLRLVEETDAFGRYDFTERNPLAFEVLERNVHGVGRTGLVPHLDDAVKPLDERVFDYVDLDPFGTPAPFVDAALRALAPSGVLAVTATDLPVLTGVARGACERRYGARPLRGSQGPEGGLRILLAYLIREGLLRSIPLEPVFGYVHDHYVRAYLRVLPPGAPVRDPALVGDPRSGGDQGPVLAGTGPLGPMWLGPLFGPATLRRLEVPLTAELPRELHRLIDRLREESAADRPFYYEPNGIAEELRLSEPPSLAALLSRLRTLGYAAARSHVRPSAFRTTAPRTVVYATAGTLRSGG